MLIYTDLSRPSTSEHRINHLRILGIGLLYFKLVAVEFLVK